MSDNEFNFLLDEYKISIVQALTDAVRADVQEFTKEFPLETNNGIEFLKWDFINSNLIRNASDERLRAIRVKRGRWELILLYDSELKYLYTFMKHKRFKQLQDQRGKREKAHYIDALVLLNKGQHSGKDQLSLFEDTAWDEGAESLLQSIAREHQNEIKCFAVIGFSTLKGDVTSVSAIIPTVELEIAHEVDWSEFISTDYNTNGFVFDFTPTVEDEDEITLTLKEQPISDNDDDDLPVILKEADNNKKDKES